MRAFLISAICATAALLVFVPALQGADFVWDDRAAVSYNADLRPTTPWSALLSHDFWGQDMQSPSSHKSFRPLAVASLRLDYMLWKLDPAGYHLTNCVLHAAATSLVVLLAQRLGLSTARTLLAGLLFALHPIHVEAVAGIVSRADLLCGVFFLAGLLCYMAAARARVSRGQALASAAAATTAASTFGTSVLFLAAVVLGCAAVACKETGITVFGAMACVELLLVPQWSGAGLQGAAGHGAAAAGYSAQDAPATPAQPAAATPRKSAEKPSRATPGGSSASSIRKRNVAAADGDGEAAPATPAASAASPNAGFRPSAASTSTVPGPIRSFLADLQRLLYVPHPGVASGRSTRVVLVLAVAAAVLMARLSVQWGVPLYKWTVSENHMAALLPRGAVRAATIAWTHAWYLGLLLWPQGLACTHGYAANTPLESLLDPRLLAIAAAYGAVAAALLVAVRNRWHVHAFLMIGLVLGPFFPASNVALWVGTEVAERLLYLPSIGYCILLALALPLDAVEAVTRIAAQAEAAADPNTPRFKRSAAAAAAAQGAAGVNRPRALLQLLACTAVLMLGGWWTTLRCGDWHNERALFERAAAVSPRDVKAANNLAMMLMASNDAAERARARQLLLGAVEAYPDHATAWANLAAMARVDQQQADAFRYSWRSLAASLVTGADQKCGPKFLIGAAYADAAVDGGATALADVPWMTEGGGQLQAQYIAERQAKGEPVTLLHLAANMLDAAASTGCDTPQTYHARGTVALHLQGAGPSIYHYYKSLMAHELWPVSSVPAVVEGGVVRTTKDFPVLTLPELTPAPADAPAVITSHDFTSAVVSPALPPLPAGGIGVELRHTGAPAQAAADALPGSGDFHSGKPGVDSTVDITAAAAAAAGSSIGVLAPFRLPFRGDTAQLASTCNMVSASLQRLAKGQGDGNREKVLAVADGFQRLALLLQPDSWIFSTNAAVLWVERGKAYTEAAVAYAQHAVTAARAAGVGGGSLASALSNAGWVSEAAGQLAEAELAYRAAAEVAPGSSLVQSNLARLQTKRAAAAAAVGATPAAGAARP